MTLLLLVLTTSLFFVVLFMQATRDYELINYSEHGTVVDGVLYSCDFSDKSHDSDRPPSNSYCDMNDSIGPLHRSVMTAQAVSKLQAARRLLENKQEARRALDGAIRLSAPIKDDLSLAEEMSKCEGLMTRTGLKRVTAESVGASLLASTGGGGVAGSSVVFSIPLSKTTEVSGGPHPKRTPAYKARALGRGGVRVEVLQRNSEDLEKKLKRNSTTSQCHPQSRSTTEVASQMPESQMSSSPHRVLCDCRRSLTSVGTNGKGWEGTANLSHGSRLRFGCLQFILSLTGQPGHSELIKALSDVRI